MTFKFTKMHGLGNDFIIIDAVRQKIDLSPHEIIALAKRNTGIGFDQCLLIEKPRQPNVDFFYRIFNADGNEVGQCGNGARCLARFAQYYGLTTKSVMQVATHTTCMQLRINQDDTVTVEMGQPKFEPKNIPLQIKHQERIYNLPMNDDKECWVHTVNVGNPHAVQVVSDVNKILVSNLGKQISEHPLFPEQVNAGFMQIFDSNHISLRVYERGCGETSACGSGAVAAVAIGRKYYQLDEQVTVSLPGGALSVEWANSESPIFLTGPATFVYEGNLL